MLIVFEGIDCSGKTTLCKMVYNWIFNNFNYTCLKMSYPNRNNLTGKLLDQYLKNEIELCKESVCLLMSANRWEDQHIIKNAILNNDIVLLDRYTTSNLYQVQMGVHVSLLLSDNELIKPDLIFYLKINIDQYKKRISLRNNIEVFENLEFQESMIKLYDSVVMENLIECSFNTIEENFNHIIKIVIEEFNKK